MGSNNDGNAAGPFLLGVLVGGAIGAVAALLLAPQKGEDTRAMIADKSTEYANAVKAKSSEVAESVRQSASQLGDKAMDQFDQIKTKTTEVSSAVAHKATEAINRGKAVVEASTAAVQNAIADGRDAASDIKTKLQSDLADATSEPGA